MSEIYRPLNEKTPSPTTLPRKASLFSSEGQSSNWLLYWPTIISAPTPSKLSHWAKNPRFSACFGDLASEEAPCDSFLIRKIEGIARLLSTSIDYLLCSFGHDNPCQGRTESSSAAGLIIVHTIAQSSAHNLYDGCIAGFSTVAGTTTPGNRNKTRPKPHRSLSKPAPKPSDRLRSGRSLSRKPRSCRTTSSPNPQCA